jgi:predicted DNA-binding transcriptional regulator AlpA
VTKTKTELTPTHTVEPFIGMTELLRLTGRKSPSGVWAKIRKKQFPQPYYLPGVKSPRWLPSEIRAAYSKERRSVLPDVPAAAE